MALSSKVLSLGGGCLLYAIGLAMGIFACATVVFVAVTRQEPFLFEKLIARGPVKLPTPSLRNLPGISSPSSTTGSTNVTGGSTSSSPPATTYKTPISSDQVPRIHAVTYASHAGRDDRFCRAVESALRYNISLVVLGWGVPWKGLSQKLEAAHAYASALPPRDVVLFTDAFDVMWAAPMDVISARFQALQSEIVFAAECGCWPHVMINESICLTSYPQSPTPYRYLNSGTWMGFAEPSARMLANVISEAGANFTDANDQKLIADLFLQGRFGIQLDYYNKIFQSMHQTLEPPLPLCDPSIDIVVQDHAQPLFNRRTLSSPAIFHFNGGGKVWHLRMEAQQWYKRRAFNMGPGLRLLRHSRVGVPTADNPSRTMAFAKLCGKYTRDLASFAWKA